MALRASRIEKLLRDNNLKAYRSQDGSTRWLVPMQEGSIFLFLDESGEQLLVRSSLIVDLTDLPLAKKAAWWQATLQENDRIRFGRYVGSEKIHFEVAIHCPSSDRLSQATLISAIACVAGSQINGRAAIEGLIAELPSVDELEPGLIRLLGRRGNPELN